MDLTARLREFCAQATDGRDESHGVVHMDEVRRNAIDIWKKEKEHYGDIDGARIERLIIATALLHDVADHKYGKTVDQLCSMETELRLNFSKNDTDLIMNIIDNISYSKECKIRKSGGVPNWDELGEEGKLVRNIVSDADKLEAIGIIGVKRCVMYTLEKEREKGGTISIDTVVNRLIEHGNEKLFILKDQYIRTAAGKDMANIRHHEMMMEVRELQARVENIRDKTYDAGDSSLINIIMGN